MKTVSVAFKAWLATSGIQPATCWLCKRKDGVIRGFTSHDTPLTFNLETWFGTMGLSVVPGVLGTGSVVYAAASGFTGTDIQTRSNLAVDTMEVHGVLTSPSITEVDLHAGLWDFCAVQVFMVNWADLTMGAMYLRSGTTGQVTLERGTFKAEQRGVTQALARVIGRLAGPGCVYVLGDSECKVVMAPFTVTSSITSVGGDLVTLYDTARTEAGPGGGVAITGITNANPGRVSLAAGLPLPNGSPVTISGVVGMTPVNSVTVINNMNNANTAFDLSVDTTNTAVYPAWISGGTVTPLGSNSGYFDNGVLTFTSGLNGIPNNLSVEVKSYVPGQITLQLPFPYLVVAGDTYTMTAGCDHSFNTCKTKFSNVVNFGGLPYVPGIDKLLQIGKHL